MNYKKIFDKLGLLENIDYVLHSGTYTKISKNRQVEQVIQHQAIPAVMSGETIVEPAVPAWEETTLVNEVYYANFPSESELVEMQKNIDIEECDISELISTFLSDKSSLRDVENDSINIVNNQIHSWSFSNIPCPTRDELHSLVAVIASRNSRATKLKQIADLEAQITPRRIREHLIGVNVSFIDDINTQIQTIRATL